MPGEGGRETIGRNAHVDTALEISGTDVKPQLVIVEVMYDGGEAVPYADEMTAFAEIGVRLPDDVRLVCVAQSGFRPRRVCQGAGGLRRSAQSPSRRRTPRAR